MEEKPGYKLRVVLGPAEFSAEGESSLVQGDFETFLEALEGFALPLIGAKATRPTKTNASPEDVDADGGGEQEEGDDPNPPLTSAPAPRTNHVPPADLAAIQRAFAVNADGLVSLKGLPPQGDTREADVMLMLLFGYLQLRSEATLTGSRLLDSARQSGITLARADLALEPRSEYVQIAGVRRGKRYTLNNRGIALAKELTHKLFD